MLLSSSFFAWYAKTARSSGPSCGRSSWRQSAKIPLCNSSCGAGNPVLGHTRFPQECKEPNTAEHRVPSSAGTDTRCSSIRPKFGRNFPPCLKPLGSQLWPGFAIVNSLKSFGRPFDRNSTEIQPKFGVAGDWWTTRGVQVMVACTVGFKLNYFYSEPESDSKKLDLMETIVGDCPNTCFIQGS